MLDDYLQNLSQHSHLYPGMEAVLNWAETRQIPWGIVTNKPSLYAEPLLRDLNLAERCASLVCPDHVKQRKPHAEPILLACAHMDADAARAVYVGDHRRDIEAGKNAGCTTVACTYGYIHASDPAQSWGADYTIDKASELTQILETL